MEKRKKKKKRKFPRILVEWICSECDDVHRFSFPYTLRSGQSPHVHFRGAKNSIGRLDIDHRISYTELNNFLNSLFSKQYHAKKYVIISYPERLLRRLKRNEEKKIIDLENYTSS